MRTFCESIKLEDSIVVSMDLNFPMTFVSDSEPYKHMVKVSFTYGKIIWTWQPDGIEAEDAWKAPK